ncbi:CHASE2 domain-containing protein [Nostoc sp.]
MDVPRYDVTSAPPRKPDERVVIVGIDEKDIEWVKQYPVPDEKIANHLALVRNKRVFLLLTIIY